MKISFPSVLFVLPTSFFFPYLISNDVGKSLLHMYSLSLILFNSFCFFRRNVFNIIYLSFSSIALLLGMILAFSKLFCKHGNRLKWFSVCMIERLFSLAINNMTCMYGGFLLKRLLASDNIKTHLNCF